MFSASHLTNTCIQTDRPDFDESVSVRSLSELDGVNGLSVSDTVGQMREIVRELFAAVHSEPTVFLPLENNFELFGLDFLIDSSKRVHLLEVNAGPDFAQTGTRLQQLCSSVMHQTVQLAIKPFITAVMNETKSKFEPTATATASAAAAGTATINTSATPFETKSKPDTKSACSVPAAVEESPSIVTAARAIAMASASNTGSAGVFGSGSGGQFLLCYDDRALAAGVKANIKFS